MNSNLSLNTKIGDLTIKDLKEIIAESVIESIQDYLEDMQALQSKNFIQSISEAREEYKSGKTVNIDELDNV